MKLFVKKSKPKPGDEPIFIPRDQLTLQKIIEVFNQKPGITISPGVILELLRQMDERIKKLETKKK
jgi:hypothetical protein